MTYRNPSDKNPKLSDLPGAIPPRNTDIHTPADESLLHEVHHALQAAQRQTCVPVRVLDLLAAAPVLWRELARAQNTLCSSFCSDCHSDECDARRAALNLARGES